jgi:hypothetical protein
MRDYTWQSIYFSYLLFVILMGGAAFFFFRSLKDGYLGANSEEAKYRMLRDDNEPDPNPSEAPTRHGDRNE